jgi:lipoprotein-anchoring transpeptidase ErfK/SrfK
VPLRFGSRGRTHAVLASCLLLLAAGCSGGREDEPDAAVAEAPPAEAVPSPPAPVEEESAAASATPRCSKGEKRPLGDRRVAYAAVVEGRAVAFRRPGGKRIAVFGRLNVNGVPTVLGVLGVVLDRRCEPRWYRVQLPLRPNGITGFVRATAVSIHEISTRIEIDLSERTIVVLRHGKTLMRLTTAIGARATPTPTGRYYVNQRLRTTDPSGPFGPGALGISAFSPVLTGWTQGGPIGIHGTNIPSTIGKAVSNGCLRVPNAKILRLFDEVPAGTPVVIRA